MTRKSACSATPAPPGVVLVAIDQGSIDFYSQDPFGITWPWPRSLYARAIDYLTAAGARAVAVDLIFSEPSPYGGEDEWLAAAMNKIGPGLHAAGLFRQRGRRRATWGGSRWPRRPRCAGCPPARGR